jgi:glutamate N-acetyltransferase/amino-acid N-acetyltransferase
LAGGIHCGIKSGSQKKDLALVYSSKFCTAAAMFTQNKVKSASVILSQENIADGKLRAIIANSGNANACTGEEGLKDAKRMAQLTADAFLISPSEVAVASTGVIGVKLPIGNIEKNIDALKASLLDDKRGHDDALEAIMTTDTRKKDIAVEITIGGNPVRIGAMTKGSGMINPNMAALQATMLAFITTDAAIIPSALDAALKNAVNKSFNCLTVDGDTSTNDMVIIMANGEAANSPLTLDSSDYAVFCSALEHVCISLAKMLARDGEGATKLVTVTVNGAENAETAKILAKSVASSSLVKTACFGADANWGRVLCAMGYAGSNFNPDRTCVTFKSSKGEIDVYKNGKPVSFCEDTAKKILLEEEIEIYITLNEGEGIASIWGCDLSYDYVKINGDYRRS